MNDKNTTAFETHSEIKDGEALFRIDNLCKSFGKLSVLKNISTEIKKGDI